MGRRAEVLDSASAAQLTRLQQSVLSWNYYELGTAADAKRQSALRAVPSSFANYQARC